MSDQLRIGTRYTVSGAAEVAIDLDLESETAVGLRIDEDVGSTVASFQIRNNAQTAVFAVQATADTENFMDLTSVNTTGNAFVITANSLTTGLGISIDSSATAITGAGRLVYVNHSGATSTSGVLSEFTSANTDETVVLRVTASAASTGTLVDLSADAMTTGTILDIGGGVALTTGKAVLIGNLDGLTTGTALEIESDSADTGTRDLVSIVNDNTAATGTTLLNLKQDALAEAMEIDMGTLDVGFINFKATADADATSAISTHGTAGATTDFIQIGLNGASAWIAVSTSDPSA